MEDVEVRGVSIAFKEYSLEEALKRMLSVGYTSVEIRKAHLGNRPTPELCRQVGTFAQTLGIKVRGFIVAAESFFEPFGSLKEYQDTIAGLKHDLDLCEALGAQDLLTWEGIRPQGLDIKAAHRDILDRITNLFQEGIEYSKGKDIRILIEPHPYTIGMDEEFLIELCDTVDSQRFGINYDCCHFGVGRPTDYIAVIRKLGRRIKHIHFCDSDRVSLELHWPLGRGSLDLEGIVSAFQEIDYHGTITLDVFGYPFPEEGTRISLGYLKSVIDRLGLQHAETA